VTTDYPGGPATLNTNTRGPTVMTNTPLGPAVVSTGNLGGPLGVGGLGAGLGPGLGWAPTGRK
jgi:hypothetical protein